MPQGRSPILELRPDHQGLRRRRGASWGRLRALRRRDPWSRRRKRRRQEHADEDHRRRACGILGPLRAGRPGDPLPLGRATRVRPASPWSIRNSASRPICRSPRTCFSARSRPIASAWCNGGAWRAKPASNSREFGIDVDPLSRLGDLPIGLQQLIEIARVLFSGARIIILDEPTSALSPPEVERLFSTLRRLRDEGTGIVFISHFIEDILRVSDTVTVFRNGRKVAEAAGGRDQQGGPDRGDDRQRPRGARRDLYRRDRAAAIERPAGGAEGRPAIARPQPAATSRSRCAPAKCWASTASWAAGSSSWRGSCSASSGPMPATLADGRRARGLRQHGRCPAAPGSPSFPRAAAPCCSTRSRSTRTSRSASSIAFPRCC